jgi:SNF2 family DNA or RNA helicase
MKIIHGTWMPQSTDDFIQAGGFYLWVETTEPKRQRTKVAGVHPRQVAQVELAAFLTTELGIKPPATYGRQLPQTLETEIFPRYFLLPTADQQPLPSLELARYLEQDLPETFDLQVWQIDCYAAKAWIDHTQVTNVIKLLHEIHFIAQNSLTEVQLGADLLFWHHYTQTLKQVILKDQYIPALRYRALAAPAKAKRTTTKSSAKSSAAKGSTTKSSAAKTKSIATTDEIYPAWEIISESYEAAIAQYAELMPLSCVAGFADRPTTPELYDRTTLLRHFSECILTEVVEHTPLPNTFTVKITDSLLDRCLQAIQPQSWLATGEFLAEYQQWQTWRDRIHGSQSDLPFYLCFQLQSPPEPEDPWTLELQVAAKSDPSQRIVLSDYWRSRSAKRKTLQQKLGDNFEQNLLLNLGYAARIYPPIWDGLKTNEPTHLTLNLEAAFAFLKDSAWVLEDAGYKVIIPAWWTPQGRQRAKIRLKASGRKAPSADKSKSYFAFDTLVDYQYELSIAGNAVSMAEWEQLVNAKTSLVQFRGQWMELDQDKMKQMLEFWQKNQNDDATTTLTDLMQLTAQSDSGIEFDIEHDQVLTDLMAKLNDKTQLEVLPDPQQFQGTLRGYQQRGVAWLHYLESLGLNGCLADDMGMGKSAQVIARLVQERELAVQAKVKTVLPTLLIAPTSVVGNWQKEMEKFAPHLQAYIHHGSQRIQEAKAFKAAIKPCDVVITSFALARKDETLLNGITWQRIVVDEAQNIKNPQAAQTKAIGKLSAHCRLALTGTPVENRLLDLWSIFNFLNPGYLGKEASFRKSFEIPIQKDNDQERAATLRKLVEPLILRRVKTDPAIIQDLPDKVEQKLYCNLTKEQASLYEATVKDVEKKLQEVEGIQRKGLILSTLLRLKQICNHPMQFLQDGSDFTPERSHKLDRLTDMIQEVMAEGESLLVFTQFTEIGDALEKYCKQVLHCNTFYLHGGTARPKRERMISEFQDPETEPTVFILSLKAGGVGITLTKANHVFHFDRWWNPAVEDQASDRAFRIGQKKNVFVHKFVAIGTLEERIDQMIEDKKKLAGAIVGSDEAWLTELDNAAFKQLIALNKRAVME